MAIEPTTSVFSRASGGPLPPWKEETQGSSGKFCWSEANWTSLDNTYDPKKNDREAMRLMAIEGKWPAA